MDKKQAVATVKDKQNTYISVNDRIWDFAEMAFREYKSAELLCTVLEEEGFAVEKGVARIPTAFTAAFGSGKPVIDLLENPEKLAQAKAKHAQRLAKTPYTCPIPKGVTPSSNAT